MAIPKVWRRYFLLIEGRKQAERRAQAECGQQAKLDHEDEKNKRGATGQGRWSRLRDQENGAGKMAELDRDQTGGREAEAAPRRERFR